MTDVTDDDTLDGQCDTTCLAWPFCAPSFLEMREQVDPEWPTCRNNKAFLFLTLFGKLSMLCRLKPCVGFVTASNTSSSL